MNNLWKYIIIASAVVLSAMVLASAYTQRARSQTGTITVTGLGEREFSSDIIVINGTIETENMDAAEGYRELEKSRSAVLNLLTKNGGAE